MSSTCHLVQRTWYCDIDDFDISFDLASKLILLHNIDLCKAEHVGLVKCYVFRENCMQQALWSRYVGIDSYLVKLGWCVDPNLYFISVPRYDFDFGFGFIYWWSTIDT